MIIFRRISFYAALIGIGLAVALVRTLQTTPPPVAHFVEPTANPFERSLAAAGIIESKDNNIAIGVPQGGIVSWVKVDVGETVKEGQPLFQLDDRDLQALLLVQKAQVSVAEATLTREKEQLQRAEAIEDRRAISQEELSSRRHEVLISQARLEAAQAEVRYTLALIDRLTLRAPKEGLILQCNVRKGEYVAPDNSSTAILLGSTDRLQVRADIDEQNACTFQCHRPAFAFPKNNPSILIPLTFERIEPYVLPKKSLTGASDERVDTRVLQVIYSFEKPRDLSLYVGQQVEIFIQE